MKISSQQKGIIALCITLIVLLSAITVFNRPDTALRDTTDLERAAAEDARLLAEYEAYLASVETDPEASKELFKKLITEEDVRAEANDLLGLDQPITIPTISDSALTITNEQGREPLLRYFTEFAQAISAIETAATELDGKLYVDSVPATALQAPRDKIKEAVVAATNVAVPREALAFHKADLVSLNEYLSMVDQSISYANTRSEDWRRASDSHRIADSQMLRANQEAQRLDTKYALGLINLASLDASNPWNPFAPKIAHAQFGNATLTDIPRILEFAFRKALSQVFAKFQVKLVQIFLNKIDQTYAISNFLYYTDTLVQGQYTNDYLAKYIGDPKDQELIKRFIPEFVCNDFRKEDLKVIFQGKARQYLGFNPAAVRIDDPEFYLKQLKMGNFFAAPDALAVYYEDVAAQARTEAKNAAFLEQISPGLKVSREVDSTIATYLQKSQSAVDKLIQAPLDVGTGNAESVATLIIQGAIESLLNNFLFKGAVFEEQRTCIKTTVAKPVVPAESVPPDTDIHIPPEPK